MLRQHISTSIPLIVAAVIGGVLTAVINAWISAPPSSGLRATQDWLIVPNPAVVISSMQRQKVSQFLEQSFVPAAVDMYKQFGSSSFLRLNLITLSNTTDKRSEPIQLSVRSPAIWAIVRGNTAYSLGEKFTLPPIDPGASEEIVALTGTVLHDLHSAFSEPDMTALEGDRKLNASSVRIDEYYSQFGLTIFLLMHPFLGWLLEFTCIIITLLVLFATVFTVYTNSSLERRARMTSKAELEKMKELIAYVESRTG